MTKYRIILDIDCETDKELRDMRDLLDEACTDVVLYGEFEVFDENGKAVPYTEEEDQ